MPTHHDDIERDQYDKINAITAQVERLVGAVDVQNQINLELMRVLKKALTYMFWIIILLIGTIIYGAIGKDGFYAVRSMPMPSITADAIPWHGDDGKRARSEQTTSE